ncbi:DUF3618 domain-containing protein [Chitinispirillales bacterium ANBcel5]|uniref:hypothetical protein n=1 Tax=Cellulosispirillum alkaliphilum TaxID=3039283 RepID=UPI002A549A63|nr:DUF3618 domain-containing protein [Chitinispirillales bacterium ANBcel5]
MDNQEKKIGGNGHVAIHQWDPVDETGKHKGSEEIEHDIDETRHSMDILMEALEGRFRPQSVVDRVLDYFGKPENRSRAKKGLSNVKDSFAESFRRNPLPVMMMATGATWALWENQKKGEEGEQKEFGKYKEKGHKKAGGGEKITEGKEKLKSETGQIREKITQKEGEAEQKADEFSSKVSESVQQTGEKTSDFVHENPLISGAIAMVAGLVAGAALPRLEKEKEVVGEKPQEIKQKIKDTGEQKILQAEDRFKGDVEKYNEEKKGELQKDVISGEPAQLRAEEKRSTTAGKNKPGPSSTNP